MNRFTINTLLGIVLCFFISPAMATWQAQVENLDQKIIPSLNIDKSKVQNNLTFRGEIDLVINGIPEKKIEGLSVFQPPQPFLECNLVTFSSDGKMQSSGGASCQPALTFEPKRDTGAGAAAGGGTMTTPSTTPLLESPPAPTPPPTGGTPIITPPPPPPSDAGGTLQ